MIQLPRGAILAVEWVTCGAACSFATAGLTLAVAGAGATAAGAGAAGAVTAGAGTAVAGTGVLVADAVWNCAGVITCAGAWVDAGAATDSASMVAFWLAVEARTASVVTRMAAMGSVEPGTGRVAVRAAAVAGAVRAATTDPLAGASGRAGSGRTSGAPTTGAGLACACAVGVSTIFAAVRTVAPWPTYSSIRSRMRASRDRADEPPMTTATRWRLPRRTEATRLKPEAWT